MLAIGGCSLSDVRMMYALCMLYVRIQSVFCELSFLFVPFCSFCSHSVRLSLDMHLPDHDPFSQLAFCSHYVRIPLPFQLLPFHSPCLMLDLGGCSIMMLLHCQYLRPSSLYPACEVYTE